MNIVFVQAIKEWREFQRDKLSLALAFLLPLFSLLLFGYGIRLESNAIPTVVVDHDNTSLSREYIQRLYATNVFVPALSVAHYSLKGSIDNGLAKLALEIPSGFTARVYRKEISPIKVLLDGTDIANVQVVSNSIEGANIYFLSMLQHMRNPDEELTPVKPVMRLWFNPGRNEALFIVPGAFAVILWMYPALLAAVAASREKEQDTIIRVYASNPNPLYFILGKASLYLLISLVMAASVMVLGALLFGVRIAHDPTPLLVSTPLFVFSAVAFGLMLGTFANSQTVAVQATSTLGFFPCLLLSGFVYPIANIPFPLSLFSIVVPARYYVQLARDAFVRGAGWSEMWPVPFVLLAFGTAFLAAASLSLARMQTKE